MKNTFLFLSWIVLTLCVHAQSEPVEVRAVKNQDIAAYLEKLTEKRIQTGVKNSREYYQHALSVRRKPTTTDQIINSQTVIYAEMLTVKNDHQTINVDLEKILQRERYLAELSMPGKPDSKINQTMVASQYFEELDSCSAGNESENSDWTTLQIGFTETQKL